MSEELTIPSVEREEEAEKALENARLAHQKYLIKQQIEDIVDSTAESVCFVKPVVDTVILRDKTYLNRQDCLHLVSPQSFDFKLLYKAYSNCDLSEIRTDETRLMNDVYEAKAIHEGFS